MRVRKTALPEEDLWRSSPATEYRLTCCLIHNIVVHKKGKGSDCWLSSRVFWLRKGSWNIGLVWDRKETHGPGSMTLSCSTGDSSHDWLILLYQNSVFTLYCDHRCITDIITLFAVIGQNINHQGTAGSWTAAALLRTTGSERLAQPTPTSSVTCSSDSVLLFTE